MALRLKKISHQTIVITGATTGIGRATACMAAEQGAQLVLAARDRAALDQLVDTISRQGGRACAVAADVGNEEDVHAIARTAIEQFGGFDSWINNAGASVFGRMLDVASEDHRRLFETNFWGVVYGSLEAARHFSTHCKSYGGTIINLGSVASDQAIPIQGMYSASKHAIKGFTDALRMELDASKLPISVTLIKPSSIATPFPQHARNTLTEQPTLPPPLYTPEVVARAILHCVERPRRNLFIGSAGPLAIMAQHAPRLSQQLLARTLPHLQHSGRPEYRRRFALRQPATDRGEQGNYRYPVRHSSLTTRASLHPVMSTALVAGAFSIAALLRRAGKRR